MSNTVFFPPVNRSVNLCTVETCPIMTANNKTITITHTIPGNIPSGHYTAHVTVNDQNNKEIICINLDLHL